MPLPPLRLLPGWPRRSWARHPSAAFGASSKHAARAPGRVCAHQMRGTRRVDGRHEESRRRWACGNTVGLKPAEQTPLVHPRLARDHRESGAARGMLNVFPSSARPRARRSASSSDIEQESCLHCIERGGQGSILAAPRSTLGRSRSSWAAGPPTFILPSSPDAELDKKAAGCAVSTICPHSGQICSPDAPVVHESIHHERPPSAWAKLASTYKWASPFDADTQLVALLVVHGRIGACVVYSTAGKESGGRQVNLVARAWAPLAYFVQPTIFSSVFPRHDDRPEGELYRARAVDHPLQRTRTTRAQATPPNRPRLGLVWTARRSPSRTASARLKGRPRVDQHLRRNRSSSCPWAATTFRLRAARTALSPHPRAYSPTIGP